MPSMSILFVLALRRQLFDDKAQFTTPFHRTKMTTISYQGSHASHYEAPCSQIDPLFLDRDDGFGETSDLLSSRYYAGPFNHRPCHHLTRNY